MALGVKFAWSMKRIYTRSSICSIHRQLRGKTWMNNERQKTFYVHQTNSFQKKSRENHKYNFSFPQTGKYYFVFMDWNKFCWGPGIRNRSIVHEGVQQDKVPYCYRSWDQQIEKQASIDSWTGIFIKSKCLVKITDTTPPQSGRKKTPQKAQTKRTVQK